MTRTTVLKFGKVENADTSDLPGWVVVEGKPTMKTAVQHTTKDGKVLSGTWQATPGTYHATYTDYEFVHMIDRITPPANAKRDASRVSCPSHGTGSRKEEDASASRECAKMGRFDIIQDALWHIAKRAGNRVALHFGEPLHLAIGGKCGCDGTDTRVADEGSKLRVEFLTPTWIVHRIDATTPR